MMLGIFSISLGSQSITLADPGANSPHCPSGKTDALSLFDLLTRCSPKHLPVSTSGSLLPVLTVLLPFSLRGTCPTSGWWVLLFSQANQDNCLHPCFFMCPHIPFWLGEWELMCRNPLKTHVGMVPVLSVSPLDDRVWFPVIPYGRCSWPMTTL